jgi:cytoskeletal protein CcmA (bactofilin family)
MERKGLNMFRKKGTPPAVDTLIGEHTVFTGNIETEGSIKVLGKVDGDIRANGDVHLEASARVQGQLFGASVYIAGRVDGNITAKGLLHLQSTARLFGDIEVGSMVTDEGAVLQGTCRMVESPAALEKAAKTTQTAKNSKTALKKSKDDD